MLLNRLADRNLSNSIGELKAITELLNKYVVLNDLWWENWGHKNSLFLVPSELYSTLMRAEELIENWYEVQRNLSLQARDFILEHLKSKVRLDAHNLTDVNA